MTTTGEYAVRGYIVDVYPVDREKPVRIEFFGDEVESIKEFDENTQRTTTTIERFEIKKFNETISTDTNSLVTMYL